MRAPKWDNRPRIGGKTNKTRITTASLRGGKPREKALRHSKRTAPGVPWYSEGQESITQGEAYTGRATKRPKLTKKKEKPKRPPNAGYCEVTCRYQEGNTGTRQAGKGRDQKGVQEGGAEEGDRKVLKKTWPAKRHPHGPDDGQERLLCHLRENLRKTEKRQKNKAPQKITAKRKGKEIVPRTSDPVLPKACVLRDLARRREVIAEWPKT